MPTRDTHDVLVDQCHDLAHRVFAEVHRTTSPHWLSLDLTMGEMKAMMMITAHGAQPVGELGRRLGISEPAASVLADKLEDDGLASRERDPHDRRRSLVTPTAEAIELASTLRQGREDHVKRWLAALEDEELEGLRRGFRGLLRTARVTGPAGHEPDSAARRSPPATQAHGG